MLSQLKETRTTQTDRVKEILSWYRSDNPGTLTNLARILNHGYLAGTGKMVILPVDQGFEHGPGRSFAPNPAGYDPRYHIELAIESGCNAYAAPLGFIEAVAADYAGEIPLVLKVNSHDVLQKEKDPLGALTASVEDALRLGCVAVGYTIYPGTRDRRLLYEQARQLTLEAKKAGLAVILWAYARGSDLSSTDETALDVIAYSAQIAAQLGAHIIKVKLPNETVALEAARKVYEQYQIPRATLTDRVKHVVESAFAGRRIVIFSGGAKKDSNEAVYDEIRAIRDGGGFGSIMGRNAFQREKSEAIELLTTVMKILKGEIE
ncbi:MAG: fructose-bisphosphate aldolase [Phototrophicales bacterium]|nr:MAG: fructose-bisphosphate aldolase [Phototrophicales bacterium]